MADIRINSLPSTASASSSDDFLALDGATNGTRKLNAYSPTFGGNLTVSGTGNFTGAIKSDASGLYPGTLTATGFRAYSNSVTGFTMYGRGTDTDVLIANRSGQSVIGVPAGGYSTLVYGNLTVNSGAVLVDGPSLGGGAQVLRFNNTNTPNSNRWAFVQRSITEGDLGLYDVNASAFRFYLNSAGNFLLGTTTDGGNGKLQLAAGAADKTSGIGFGTDVSLYRQDANTLVVQPTGSSKKVLLYGDSTVSGLFNSLSSYEAIYFDPSAHSIKLATNGFTALTLDTSQRMFTASAAKIGSTSGTVDSRLHVYESTAVSTSNGLTLEQASTGDSLLSFLLTGVQRWSVGIDNSDSDKFKIGTGDLGAADKFTVDTSGNATVAGSIAIGNTVQTAAAVVSTHKVTISIGGSTYYLLATNV